MKPMNHNFVKEQIEAKGWKLLSEYKNNKTAMNTICPKGHNTKIRWNDFYHGNGCKYCANNAKLTIEFVKEQMQKKGWKLISGDYKTANGRLTVICPSNNTRNISWSEFRTRGCRCKNCKKENPQKFGSDSYRKIFNCKENSLLAKFPKIAFLWHPTKNGEIKPSDISCHSSYKAWWMCKNNKTHPSWQARVFCMTNNTTGRESYGCPYCSGKKVCETNNLKSTRPDIATEWHPTLNKNLMPSNVVSGSNKKVWWQGTKCKHEWKASISNRSLRNTECPYCSNKKTNIDNCLFATHKTIALEWHPTLNSKLTPKDVTAGSHKDVWWKCAKNHTWQSKVYYRAKGSNCPTCANGSNGEWFISFILQKQGLSFDRQKTFDNCQDKKPLPFDFFVKSKNCCIEFQGEQHYKPIKFCGNKKSADIKFTKTKNHDSIKEKFCKNNGICLVTIPYWEKIQDIEDKLSFLWTDSHRSSLQKILEREVARANGNPLWIAPALDWCIDEEHTNDPRRVITVCLCGRDALLDGSYQKHLRATTIIR